MKVLYLVNYAGNGGSEKYVEKLLRAYHPHRCQCGLCYNIEGPLVDMARDWGVPVYQLEMKNPFDLAAAKRLAKLCRDEGYDVIHAQYPRENYIALLARRFGSGARVVYTVHVTLEQPLPWRILNRFMTPQDHRVIALCEEGAEVMRRNGVSPRPTVVVYNGIDPTMPPRDRSVLTELGVGEDELAIIALSRLSPEKGMDILCRAAALLRERADVPFRVLIAGDGEQKEELRALIAELHLEDTVLLLGFREDTRRLLAACDIYVNSSRSELMSFAILEAMACSLPVAATRVGGNPTMVELDGQAGVLAPPEDPAGLCDVLLTLMKDEALRQKLGSAGRQKVLGVFSQDQMLENTFQTYM